MYSVDYHENYYDENREEIVKMYQAADIFVLPSYREGLPLTLFEAMAAGLPIVASPVNGIPYEMKDPENGFLVKYGNNEGFAEKIIEFLDMLQLKENFHRLFTIVDMEFAPGHRWAKMLGFHMEAIMEQFRSNKKDAALYVRLL